MRLAHAAPVGIGATQTSSAALIAYGLGWGAAATITPRPSMALPGNFMVPPGPILALADLNTSLLRLASRWWMNDREAERRVAIDAFLRTFLHRLDHAAIGVYLERALNTPGAAYSVSTGVAANQYIGHGDLDYVIGGPVAPAGAPVTLIPAGALGAPAFAAITARMLAPPVPPPLCRRLRRFGSKA
ncbi:hypothetical protein VZ95_13050 [Elstera litoralis]|uniref:Uncharacterized protein n=1 Tax=Elstera litoralis TaxID=552518 RepID=A0A0F3IRE8_9PROT|nr:hypothetical protein [Elstera litoralis]KJV09192.1 hypothetical protein VZ95_13050 [Elstera litoralis]